MTSHSRSCSWSRLSKALSTAFTVTVEAYSGEFNLERSGPTEIQRLHMPMTPNSAPVVIPNSSHQRRSGLSRSLNSLRRLKHRMSNRRSNSLSSGNRGGRDGSRATNLPAPLNVHTVSPRDTTLPTPTSPSPMLPLMERADSWASGVTLVVTPSRIYATN
ncbi:MAG: hypothetical protein DHS80DRAFT_28378 [Piptocephalis tieghemiana]|nr:MAG: hypothetical protein DHS80DRAFT_28378 [Piptocephalis tieghemiana]